MSTTADRAEAERRTIQDVDELVVTRWNRGPS